jgi:hypothetical protein
VTGRVRAKPLTDGVHLHTVLARIVHSAQVIVHEAHESGAAPASTTHLRVMRNVGTTHTAQPARVSAGGRTRLDCCAARRCAASGTYHRAKADPQITRVAVVAHAHAATRQKSFMQSDSEQGSGYRNEKGIELLQHVSPESGKACQAKPVA